MPLATLLVLLPLMSTGVASWFHNVSTHGGKVIENLKIFHQNSI
jgi:hypothetical protein